MKIAFGIGTLALTAIILGACGGAAPDEAEKIDHDQSDLGTCGLKPKAPVCFAEKCTSDGTWEPEPQAAGTVCQSTGHCDGNGSCVIPPPPFIQPPPRDLGVYQVNAHQILLEYTCGANATSHQYYRQTNGGAFNALFGPTDGCPAGHWVDYDHYLIPGARYCYYVVGYNSLHQASSNTVCIDAQLDTVAPALPTGQVRATTKGGTLTFHDQATNEDGYRVYLREVGTTDWIQRAEFLNPNPALNLKDETYGRPGPDFTFDVTGLSDRLTYEFKVVVFHDHAPVSAEIVFPSFQPLPNLPTPPTDLSALFITDTSFQLRWAPGMFQDDYQLSLDRQTTDGIQTMTLPGANISKEVGPLAPGTRYCARMMAHNRAGWSASTGALCVTTTGTAPPVSHTDGIWLRPANAPDDGFVINAGSFGPIAGGFVDSFQLLGQFNDSRLNGFRLVKPGTTSGSACSDPSAIFLPINGTLSAAQMTALYGAARPSLASGIVVEGCAVWSVLPPMLQTITMTIHYSTPH